GPLPTPPITFPSPFDPGPTGAGRFTDEEKGRTALESEKEREHRKKMPPLEGKPLETPSLKGSPLGALPLTGDHFRRQAAWSPLEGGRQVASRVGGQTVTLTPARLKSAKELHAGPQNLGRFCLEQPTEQLAAGEHDLILAADRGAWRVFAVRRGGTEVVEAKDVRVRVLEGTGEPPAHEVRHGSVIFMMYYVIDVPVVVTQYGPWWNPYPYTTVVWMPQVVQVVFYFF